MTRKNKKNIYKLAQELVDSMDFMAMEEAAFIAQVNYLEDMTDSEFKDEWNYVIKGEDL